MPFLLGPVGDARLEAVLRTASGQELSYPEVGTTRAGEAPSGYRVDHLRAGIPADDPDAAFAAGVRALRGWEVHRGAGAPVFPAAPSLAEGETVVVTLRMLPSLVTMAAPCRVVYVTDEHDKPDRFGFGYGTLPGHPEVGEEAFHVVRTSEGVRFEVDVFWKPVHPLVRLGGPVSRWVQAMMTRRYLAAFRRAVT